MTRTIRTTWVSDRGAWSGSGSRLRDAGLFLLASLVWAAGLVPAPVSANVIRIEAESYVNAHELGGNGSRIGRVGCSSASEGQAVDGLDVPGEYVEWNFPVAEAGCFVDSLCSAGGAPPNGMVREFTIQVFAQGSTEPLYEDGITTIEGNGVSG